MADIGKSVRNLLINGVKAVNSAANTIANTTRQKVDELNLQSDRKELMDQVAETAYKLWKDGAQLPEAIGTLMQEIAVIDDELARLQCKTEAKETNTTEEHDNGEDETDAPILNVADQGPYARAAAEAEQKDAEPTLCESLDQVMDDLKEGVKKTAAAVENFFADDPDEQDQNESQDE